MPDSERTDAISESVRPVEGAGSDEIALVLAASRRLVAALASSASRARLYLEIVEETSQALQVERALLSRIDDDDPTCLRIVAGSGPLAGLEGVVLPIEGSFEGGALSARDVIRADNLGASAEFFLTPEHRRHIGPVLATRLGVGGRSDSVLLVAHGPKGNPFRSREAFLLAELAPIIGSALAIIDQIDVARAPRSTVEGWRRDRSMQERLDFFDGLLAAQSGTAFRLGTDGSLHWMPSPDGFLGEDVETAPRSLRVLLGRMAADDRSVARSALEQLLKRVGPATFRIDCAIVDRHGSRRPARFSIWRSREDSRLFGVLSDLSRLKRPALPAAGATARPVDEAHTTAVPPEPGSSNPGWPTAPASTTEWPETAGEEPETRVEGTEFAGGDPESTPETPEGDPQFESARPANTEVPPEPELDGTDSGTEAPASLAIHAEKPSAGGDSDDPRPRVEPTRASIVEEIDGNLAKPPLELITGFTDIHCHLLPGVDDGAVDLDDAMTGLQAVFDAGVRQIVLTPHLRVSALVRANGVDPVANEAEGLRVAAASRFPDLMLARGSEVMLDLPHADLSLPWLRLGGSRFVLVEFAGFWIPPRSLAALKVLVESGYVPVMSHPERYENAQREGREAIAWREAGMRLQVNCGSLLGHYGPIARDRAWHLLAAGVVDCLASDYHGRGPYPVGECVRLLEVAGGGQQARQLMGINPGRMVQGADPVDVDPLARPESLIRRLATGRLFRR